MFRLRLSASLIGCGNEEPSHLNFCRQNQDFLASLQRPLPRVSKEVLSEG